MMPGIDISLVVACYNEEDILEKHLKEIFSVLDNTKYSYEIIFVDDFSKDRTRKIIEEIISNYPDKRLRKIYHEKNTGRGKVVADGIRAAEGRMVGFIDIDLEVHARYMPSLALEIDRGADLAIGQRIYKFKFGSIHRHIMSKTYKWLVKKWLKVPVKDTETGYKFFNRVKILPIVEEITEPGWFWDTEIMVRSYYRGLKITEVPVLFTRRPDKKSTVKLLEDSWDYFIKLKKFKRRVLNYIK